MSEHQVNLSYCWSGSHSSYSSFILLWFIILINAISILNKHHSVFVQPPLLPSLHLQLASVQNNEFYNHQHGPISGSVTQFKQSCPVYPPFSPSCLQAPKWCQWSKQTLLHLFIAHMDTTGNVTKSHRSPIRCCTPTQTAISILSPKSFIRRGKAGRRRMRRTRLPVVCGRGCLSKQFYTSEFTRSALALQTMRPGRTESSSMDGGRKRRGGRNWGEKKLAPFLIPPKAVPTKGPPLGSRHGAAASSAGSKQGRELKNEREIEGERMRRRE